jgi:hypothetical protein
MSAPHPVEQANAAEFDASADDVFGRIASRYDLLCDLFSFWIHRHWKRRVALRVASQEWHDLLDSASGTGDIIIRILNRQPSGARRRVVASDRRRFGIPVICCKASTSSRPLRSSLRRSVMWVSRTYRSNACHSALWPFTWAKKRRRPPPDGSRHTAVGVIVGARACRNDRKYSVRCRRSVGRP